MKKILFMSILTLLLSIMGCNREKQYLKNHKVIYYGTSEFNIFENNVQINKKEAYKLGLAYAKKNDLVMGNNLFFVIDNYYAFTNHYIPKMPAASTKGIWINANTGEVKYIKEGIMLRPKFFPEKKIKDEN
ncbi:hypothetical protein ETU08_09705 [Apibacter muscae]|uniref:hypothetical protein n=1 Tax=Apibacter muscae TaxID=2509004 RepID=UPI0011ADABAB|nr:hypothetical protein [Apibacter muscae]TWP27982.1 hypothetical protein ETU08_09705 [Apibacter muscae]